MQHPEQHQELQDACVRVYAIARLYEDLYHSMRGGRIGRLSGRVRGRLNTAERGRRRSREEPMGPEGEGPGGHGDPVPAGRVRANRLGRATGSEALQKAQERLPETVELTGLVEEEVGARIKTPVTEDSPPGTMSMSRSRHSLDLACERGLQRGLHEPLDVPPVGTHGDGHLL